MSETLANLLHETRQFPPPPALAAQANVTADAYAAAAADRLGFWDGRPTGCTGTSRGTRSSTGPTRRSRSGSSAASSTSRTTASTGTSRPATATGSPSTSRASPATPARITYADLHREVSQAANALLELGRGPGRPGRHLPADDPRGGDRDAGLRPDRRHALGGLRRLLRRGAARPDRGRRGQARDHRRRRLPARRGRRALKPAVDEAVAHCPTRRATCSSSGAPARTSPGTRGATSGGTTRSSRPAPEHTAAGVRRRAPAVHPLHLRHHREAEGHPAHHRRLPDPGRVHPRTRSSTSSRRPTSTGAPPTSAGSPGTATSSTGRWPTAPPRSCTRAPRTPRTGAAAGRSSQKYGVTILYTAPTAIRTFMKWGDDIPAQFDLSSLRLLGSVGEPINPEAWMWYREDIGGDRCPIVDTWWQTETGAHHDQPAARGDRHQARLGACGRCPASAPTSSTTTGSRCPTAAAATWSCASRGRRCCAASGATTSATSTPTGRGSPGIYFAGDGAKKDEDGDLWLLGRVDDVMNVSGPPHLHHRDRVGAGRRTRRSPRRPSSARPTRPPGRRSSRS